MKSVLVSSNLTNYVNFCYFLAKSQSTIKYFLKWQLYYTHEWRARISYHLLTSDQLIVPNSDPAWRI